jgi:hypothetical protein
MHKAAGRPLYSERQRSLDYETLFRALRRKLLCNSDRFARYVRTFANGSFKRARVAAVKLRSRKKW